MPKKGLQQVAEVQIQMWCTSIFLIHSASVHAGLTHWLGVHHVYHNTCGMQCSSWKSTEIRPCNFTECISFLKACMCECGKEGWGDSACFYTRKYCPFGFPPWRHKQNMRFKGLYCLHHHWKVFSLGVPGYLRLCPVLTQAFSCGSKVLNLTVCINMLQRIQMHKIIAPYSDTAHTYTISLPVLREWTPYQNGLQLGWRWCDPRLPPCMMEISAC